MVTVTDRALEELRRVASTKNAVEEKFLRLTTPPEWTGEGDFGIVIDVERSGDKFVEHEGMRVLIVDPNLAQQLSSSVLDFKGPANRPHFTLDVYQQKD